MTNLKKEIERLYEKYESERSGEVAKSIPELSKADPDTFAISVATASGQLIEVGDCAKPFTIQSISKPFVYGLALERHGVDFVEQKVGIEPTGEDYDSVIKLDDSCRPYNPMVNSGAIAVTSLIKGPDQKQREAEILSCLSDYAGKKLSIDNSTYRSEKESGDKNYAIGHLLKHFKVVGKDIKNDVELYFKQCSVELTCSDLAMMGATLANNGVNPLTKKQCAAPANLRNILSILLTCGMYNYSGEWVFDVGVPAKSGISGGTLMIVPGLMAIAVYSPRLDKRGNSVRGIKVCEELSRKYRLHILDSACPRDIDDIL